MSCVETASGRDSGTNMREGYMIRKRGSRRARMWSWAKSNHGLIYRDLGDLWNISCPAELSHSEAKRLAS